MRHSFILFVEDDKGPLFREYFDNIDEARRKAAAMANQEGLPFVLFSVKHGRQVERFEPHSGGSQPSSEALPPAPQAASPCAGTTGRT